MWNLNNNICKTLLWKINNVLNKCINIWLWIRKLNIESKISDPWQHGYFGLFFGGAVVAVLYIVGCLVGFLASILLDASGVSQLTTKYVSGYWQMSLWGQNLLHLRTTIVKVSISLTYRFNAVSIKILFMFLNS